MDERSSLWPFIIRALAVVILFVSASFVAAWYVPGLRDPVTIREYVEGFGVLSPVVFVLIQAGQVLIAPIPGQVVAVAGGYLFGPWQGAAYSLIGMGVGSTIAFVLSRRYGRPYVNRQVGAARVAQFDTFIEQSGVAGLFLLFLLPGLPDDVICFVAGITTIRIRVLAVMAVVGRAPGIIVASFIGAGLAAERFVVVGLITVMLAIVWGIGYYHRDQLLDLLDRYAGTS